MLAVGALYTPQAAGTAGADRAGRKSAAAPSPIIFLGWSLAAAVGLPLITFIASRYGWRTVYGGIGADRLLQLRCCWRGGCRVD